MVLRLSFLMALLGTVGSLFFSEILKYPPCSLCWYQRIFLFPLVFVFGVGLWREDANYKFYAFPLALTGFIISLYHNLLYFGVISEALSPCTAGLSCSAKQLQLFGFVTIPFLAAICFLTLSSLLTFAIARKSK